MKKKTIDPKELRELFDAARESGLAHTQKEFAGLIGLDPTSLSSFLKGKAPITETMMKRIKNEAFMSTLHISGNGNAAATGPNSSAQVVSGDVTALIAELAEQRKVFVDQLKVKDEQISQLTGMLHEMISGKK